MLRFSILLAVTLLGISPTLSAETKPQLYKLQARASEIDPRAKEHPEIAFVSSKKGKPEDIQNACVAYLRRLAELSGQDAAGITAGSLQSISIFPTASFADKGVDAHRLEGIEISFSGDSP